MTKKIAKKLPKIDQKIHIFDFHYVAPSGKEPGSLVKKIMHFD